MQARGGRGRAAHDEQQQQQQQHCGGLRRRSPRARLPCRGQPRQIQGTGGGRAARAGGGEGGGKVRGFVL